VYHAWLNVYLFRLKSSLVPESLRWLVVKKQENKAKKILHMIAKINKRDIQGDITLPTYEVQKHSLYDIRLLFRSGYAKYTLVLWYSW